jgi:hypothetical protein
MCKPNGRSRARTLSMKRLSKQRMQVFRLEYRMNYRLREERPTNTAECRERGLGTKQKPCPWVTCPWHLYLEVDERNGSIKLNFPDLEPTEIPHTCALRLAELGEHTLEEVGEAANITRERVRQLESRAFGRLRLRVLSEGIVVNDYEPRSERVHYEGNGRMRVG